MYQSLISYVDIPFIQFNCLYNWVTHHDYSKYTYIYTYTQFYYLYHHHRYIWSVGIKFIQSAAFVTYLASKTTDRSQWHSFTDSLQAEIFTTFTRISSRNVQKDNIYWTFYNVLTPTDCPAYWLTTAHCPHWCTKRNSHGCQSIRFGLQCTDIGSAH